MSFFSSIANIGTSIIKSPITKVVVGGAAIVFPPVGVPAVAAVAAANVALATIEKTKPARDAIARAVAPQRNRARATLLARARVQVAAGVPRARVKAQLARSVRGVDRAVAQRLASVPVNPNNNKQRAALAASLKRTVKLAAKGDAGAKRALATFKLVASARRGDPKARAAIEMIAHRYEVGQRVTRRYKLTANGRVRSRS